jgi:predicted AAA+ superfamily ATPase
MFVYKNITDNHNCLCGEMESTYHYLFKCPKYTRQRNSLFRNLFQLLNIQPSEDLLLFGSPDLDINSNISFYDSA